MRRTALDALETLRECLEDDKNMDVTVRRHTELAIHHLELAAEIEHAIEERLKLEAVPVTKRLGDQCEKGGRCHWPALCSKGGCKRQERGVVG